jgi:SAM-dependent methyltransferase
VQPYRVAETYDPLMLPLVPYPELARHITGRLRAELPGLRTVLDVACGTGNLTIPMADLGIQVAGLDIAPQMLAIARDKAAAADQEIVFSCQDMRQAYGGDPVDAVTCVGGSIHFLDTNEALSEGLTTMYRALRPGGLLAFDLFAAGKMRTLFTGTRAGDQGDFYAVTTSRCDDTGHITHDLVFFLRDGDDRYRREDERHRLRIHDLATVRQILADVGFTPPTIERLHPTIDAEYLRDVSLILTRKPVHPA